MPFLTVQFTAPVFLCFTFYKTLELQGRKSGGLAVDKPPRGTLNVPVDYSRNRVFCCRLRALYKLFHMLFECSDSTSVFTSFTVSMCNCHEVSSESLVVMQAH
jgi:hypothetical protein